MKISIAAVGSRGDVQPYVALGLGLQKAGHSIQLIADLEFEHFILEKGLSFAPISANPRKLLDEDFARLGKNIFRFAKWFKEQNQLFARQNFYELLDAIDTVDAIIFSPLAPAAFHIAEFKKVPGIGAFLQPLTPTRRFGPTNLPPLPDWIPCKGKINWSRFRWNSKIYFYMLKDTMNECRQEVLNLPPLAWKAYANSDLADYPILYGFSSHVVPKPPDWGENIQLAGYWFLDSENWQPPDDLVKFIDGGPTPVYVGFGSMTDKKISMLTNTVVKAISESGQRGILALGWNGEMPANLPENIFLIKEAPHDWLFPQMSAVVHHGGAGTTAAGFRAGVPSVVIPFSFDQPFWAAKVEELGVGPRSIPRKQLTVDNLAQALRFATTSQRCRSKARALGNKIKAEDGVSRAVRIIEESLLPLKNACGK